VSAGDGRFVGHRVAHFFMVRFARGRCPGFYHRCRGRSTGILCGTWKEPHITSSCQAEGVVRGARNRSNARRRSRRWTWKLRPNDPGRVRGHNGGRNRARAALPKELSTKVTSHH
jgi:hypothetical protein